MKYFKVTYMWWFSVVPSTGYVSAESKEEVWKNFEKKCGFGYEDIDIKSVEEVSVEKILQGVVKDLTK